MFTYGTRIAGSIREKKAILLVSTYSFFLKPTNKTIPFTSSEVHSEK